jgi:hypothetical protein
VNAARPCEAVLDSKYASSTLSSLDDTLTTGVLT